MSQKTNKTSKNKNNGNPTPNMENCHNTSSNSLIDSTDTAYDTAKKQTNKKHGDVTDCK